MPKIKLNFETLETEDEKNKAIEILSAGIQSSFWKYLKQVLEYNIKETEEKILSEIDMPDLENKSYKMYLQSLKDLLDAPKKHLSFLETGEEEEEDDNPDPHY